MCRSELVKVTVNVRPPGLDASGSRPSRSKMSVRNCRSVDADGPFTLVIRRTAAPHPAHIGPLMPPSFRTRQKWIMMSNAAASGIATQWST